SETIRAELDIPPDAQIIVFNGNDHAAVALDIRQLYEAVEILLERGRNVILIRTGHALPANYEGLQFCPGPRCIELGFIERERVPDIMSLADVVIQPGNADAFNTFRLPAKVPEYLSMGKPLIMGAVNIGCELAESNSALVLAHLSPVTMANAVEQLLDDYGAAETIASRGKKFARHRFAEATIAPELEAFYEACLRKLQPISVDAAAQ
ncbi:MAG: hypothetical protein RL693_121, partial [Verrucomicrobiota bacterium]